MGKNQLLENAVQYILDERVNAHVLQKPELKELIAKIAYQKQLMQQVYRPQVPKCHTKSCYLIPKQGAAHANSSTQPTTPKQMSKESIVRGRHTAQKSVPNLQSVS